MEPQASREEMLVETYKLLLGLWVSENSVKTSKLEVLLATNALLVSAFFLANQTIWIAVVGFFFSLIWILSIGRTLSFQQHWRSQMEALRKECGGNPLFEIHAATIRPPFWGRVPSKYYLLGAPMVMAVAWLGIMIFLI